MEHYTHNNCEQSTTSAELFETIVSLANHHGESIPEKQFIQWLERGNIESDSYTYAELDANARSLAVAINNLLVTNEISSNEDTAQKVALIVVQPGLSFVVSFFACLYAGVIAVPTYPPRKNEPLNKLGLLALDADADLIITDKETAPLIGELGKQALACFNQAFLFFQNITIIFAPNDFAASVSDMPIKTSKIREIHHNKNSG